MEIYQSSYLWILWSEFLLRDRPGRHDWQQPENHEAVDWAELCSWKAPNVTKKPLSETSQSLLAWRNLFEPLLQLHMKHWLNWYCELTPTNGRHYFYTLVSTFFFIISNLNVALDIFWKCPVYTLLSIKVCLARVNIILFHSLNAPSFLHFHWFLNQFWVCYNVLKTFEFTISDTNSEAISRHEIVTKENRLRWVTHFL